MNNFLPVLLRRHNLLKGSRKKSECNDLKMNMYKRSDVFLEHFKWFPTSLRRRHVCYVSFRCISKGDVPFESFYKRP